MDRKKGEPMEEKQGYIQIDATIERREGVHSDLVMALTDGATTRLDFVQSDGPANEENVTTAVLVSRVFMDNAHVIQLRDMLNRHTASWVEVGGAADDSQ